MASHESVPRRAVAAGVLVALLMLATWSAAAHARTITVNQTAQMRLIKRVGTTLYEQGTATGTLPGVVAATLTVNVTKVGGEITFYPRGGGSITFKAQGVPQAAGVVSRATGTMTIVRGTGRFADARGRVRFNGILNRRSWAISVTASGRMTY